MAESLLLWGALALYGLSMGSLVAAGPPVSGLRERLPRTLLEAAVALHTLSLLMRWQAHGHGPFTTMHEILSSNLWSLSLALLLATWAVHEARRVLLAAAPVLAVLGLWLLMADNRPGHLPPTYATTLLYLHTLIGKAYLGLLLVAVALGAVPWLREHGLGAACFAHAADDRRCDELAHRFAAFAFVFETLMLIVGAVWAQDAWGRYWAWDPLESWAFASWLALAGVLHARATLRPPPARHGLWLAATFVLAFVTFFGVPFISTTPHKGAV